MRLLSFTIVPTDEQIVEMLRREKRWEIYRRNVFQSIQEEKRTRTEWDSTMKGTRGGRSTLNPLISESLTKTIHRLSEQECCLLFGDSRHQVINCLQQRLQSIPYETEIRIGDGFTEESEFEAIGSGISTTKTSLLSLADYYRRSQMDCKSMRGLFDEQLKLESMVNGDVSTAAEFEQQWHATSVLRLKRDLRIYQSQELDDVGDFDVVFRGFKTSKLNARGIPWDNLDNIAQEKKEEEERKEAKVKEFFLDKLRPRKKPITEATEDAKQAEFLWNLPALHMSSQRETVTKR